MSFRFFGASFLMAIVSMGALAQQPYYPPPAQQQQYNQQPPYYQQPQYQQPYAPQQYAPPPPPPPPPPSPPPPSPQSTDTQNGYQQTGHAMTLHEKLAARDASGANGVSTVIRIAVGDKDNANVSAVMPIIQDNASHWLSLVQDYSNGSFESATGVCLGLDAAGLVQLDSAVERAHSTKGIVSSDERGPQSCKKEMRIIGPIYGVYTFVIVKADSPFSDMDSFLTSPPSSGFFFKTRTRKWVVADGSEGSGSAATMNSLMRANKTWESNAVPKHIGGDEALAAVADGTADAYVVVEPLTSDFINTKVNQYGGGGKFKFLSVNPSSAFFTTGYTDSRGEKYLMYQPAELPGSHWYHHLNTVGTDMVLIVNTRFAATNTWAVSSLSDAFKSSLSVIHQQTGMPDDWKPAYHLAN